MVNLTEIQTKILFMLWTGITAALDWDYCPEDSFEITHQARLCVEQLDKNITLSGQLTRDSLREHCGMYKKSMRCMHQLISLCPEHEHITPIRDGIRRLCEDEDTFTVYLRHASCYSRHHPHTLQCLVDFTSAINTMSAGGEYYLHDFDTLVCRAYDNLSDCVHEVLQPECGDEATLLYEELVKAEVPAEVSAICQVEYYDVDGDQVTRSNVNRGTTTTSSLASLSVQVLIVLSIQDLVLRFSWLRI